jgi:hypothetical protein
VVRAVNLDGTITMPDGGPTPLDKMRLLDETRDVIGNELAGGIGIDVGQLIMSMMEDVRDSAMLAAFAVLRDLLENVGVYPELAARTAKELTEGIGGTVDDFLTNTYGDI